MIDRYARLRCVAIALLALALLGTNWVSAATPVATSGNTDLGPVIPEYRDAFRAALPSMPHYVFDLTLDPAQSTIGGSLVVTFLNETGATLTELPFRLYPNASYYDEGATNIAAITSKGQTIEPRFDESETVLIVDLPTVLLPDETVEVMIDFETVIPRNASGSFGILNADSSSGQIVLSDWYPVIAGWDETGWRLESPTQIGDPTFSATSVFDVRLALPEGYDVIATGEETYTAADMVEIASGPVRDFAMVIAPGLDTVSARAGQTTVSVHADPANHATALHVLDTAVAALEFYNDAFGAFPFQEIDLVETALSLAYGVSWSGIIFIDDDQLARSPDDVASLDFTVFHEVSHQWWGGTVGANSNDHTFMVEGLANVTGLLAQADVQGPEAAIQSLYGWIVTPYLNLLDGPGDAIADVSIFDQPATAPLSTLAYGKGALGLLAIRNQIGDSVFREALTGYAEQFRLGIAEPDDLLTAFEVAAGESLQELWTFWFESADTTRADVEALVPLIVASLG